MGKQILLGKVEDFPAGELTKLNVEGIPLVVAPVDDGFCAVLNRCSHMPLPVNLGKIEDNVITCPWHGSRFDICTGENLDWVRGIGPNTKFPEWSRKLLMMGRQPTPLTVYPVTERDGELYIEIEES